jgi:CBS domain-containing protein
MLLADCMIRDVRTCTVSTTVADAAKEMSKYDVGSLIVADGKEPVGIFTERDLLKRVVALDKDPRTTKIGDVMTKNVFTVRADEYIGNVHHRLTQKGIRHAPVVDQGVLVGIVSVRDLAGILEGQIYNLYFRKKDLSGDY